ncbi:MAG: tyrosine-type recombinase/integrase [Lachnospiraceae bacterium]
MILSEKVEQYLQYCRFQKGLDEKTVKAYQNDLGQFVTFMQKHENELSKQVLNQYVMDLQQKYKKKSVKRKIASTKALFNYLVDEELLEVNPFHLVKTRFKEEMVLPKIIPRDKIEQLLNHLYQIAASENLSDCRKKLILRDIAVVEMLFSTGMRISELCNLRDSAFDIKNGVLCIQGKGAKERYLQIGNETVLMQLSKYREVFKEEIKSHGYFFVNRYGMPLSEQSARKMIHKHAGTVIVDTNITPHMFRHSFATFLMEEDVNIRYIQKMLGHSSITTTQIYTYVTVEKEKEILKTKHPRNKMCIELEGAKRVN